MTYTVNDDNQYTIMRDVSLTYDVAGNVNTYASWTYSWDNENRLIQVVSTSKLIKFSYDTQGRRIEKKVWNNTTGTGTPATYLKYLYDGWNLIAELNGKSSDAVVRTYSWGPEAQGVPGTLRMISDSNGVYFPAYDPNGNVMGLVKASDGTVCAQYEYLPYGELVTATGTMASSNPIRFSTKYYDTEARLYYYGYRYYSPDMGRWLSRDPIEERGGLNLYAFVNNDPVNKWDLWGMKQEKSGCEEMKGKYNLPKIVFEKSEVAGGGWKGELIYDQAIASSIMSVHFIYSIRIKYTANVYVLCKCCTHNEYRKGKRIYITEPVAENIPYYDPADVPIVPSDFISMIINMNMPKILGTLIALELAKKNPLLYIAAEDKKILNNIGASYIPEYPDEGEWEKGLSPCENKKTFLNCLNW